MEPHPYGWLSLMPPVVAIAMAMITRRVVLSLVAGVLVGALITTHGNPFQAVYDTLEIHIWTTVVDPGKLRLFAFTLTMGAMVGVINRGGGMQSLINSVSRLAKTRRSGQLTTWLIGLMLFFDDYANCLLLGSTLRPLCDRLRISREKLAYLVDSTAAPVACLALVSTWIAVEIAYLRDGLDVFFGSDAPLSAFDLFVQSIPYRFYVIQTLLFIPMVALLHREFGPMLAAERRAIQSGAESTPGAIDIEPIEVTGGPPSPNARWYHALLPIILTLSVILALIIVTGKRKVMEQREAEAATAAAAGQAETTASDVVNSEPIAWREIFGEADSGLALQYGAVAGLALAAFMAWAQRLMSYDEIISAAGWGAKIVLPAIAILWAAAAMSRLTSGTDVNGNQPPAPDPYKFQDFRLYTGDYLKQLLIEPSGTPGEPGRARVPIELMPTIVFVLSAVVSFCTGTSFGTMGILVPMVLGATLTLLSAGGAELYARDPLLLCSVGSVLAGSVFGDHCSPISDTTILSSQSSGCDHIAHVWTQMPYAMTVAGVIVLLGTLPLGLGISVWILLPVQTAALLMVLLFFGKRVE